MNNSQIAPASAFTLFVNNGGLKIPSQSVYNIFIEFAEKLFKVNVCKDGLKISRENKLKQKLVLSVCNHFVMDSTHQIFQDHDQGSQDNSLEENHRSSLIKLTAERYFNTLRLFTYGKRYNDKVVYNGQPSVRHQLTKMTLFKNQ